MQGDLMPSQSGKVVAVIPAAGMGIRMGLKVPKQYVDIKNKPLLIYTLEKFQQCRFIDDILLVVSKHLLG
jgi:2-C-methyl-D-erythritol 4-phosphate cytidylyltransferase